MDLGTYFPCLNVQDLAASMAFYKKLNFQVTEDHSDEGWAVLRHNNMVLCLYQGHIINNLINPRPCRIDNALCANNSFVI